MATAQASGPPPNVVPCIPGMHAARNPIGGEDGAKRQAASERLGNGDDVGSNAIVLVGKVASGAAEAALNLIKHQQTRQFVWSGARRVRETPG